MIKTINISQIHSAVENILCERTFAKSDLPCLCYLGPRALRRCAKRFCTVLGRIVNYFIGMVKKDGNTKLWQHTVLQFPGRGYYRCILVVQGL